MGFRSEGGAGQGQVVMVRRVSRCVVTASVTRSSSSSGAGGWRGGEQGSQKKQVPPVPSAASSFSPSLSLECSGKSAQVSCNILTIAQ